MQNNKKYIFYRHSENEENSKLLVEGRKANEENEEKETHARNARNAKNAKKYFYAA